MTVTPAIAARPTNFTMTFGSLIVSVRRCFQLPTSRRLVCAVGIKNLESNESLVILLGHLIRMKGCKMGVIGDKFGGGGAHWSEHEVDERAFKDARLGRRFADLLKRLGGILI